jgi:hypothetical protein
MLRVLVGKDLRRAWRNPVPYLIHLCLPLVLTGLLGMVFGGVNRRDGGGLGRIQVAVVDEDDSAVTRLLRGVLSQEQVGSPHRRGVSCRATAALSSGDQQHGRGGAHPPGGLLPPVPPGRGPSHPRGREEPGPAISIPPSYRGGGRGGHHRAQLRWPGTSGRIWPRGGRCSQADRRPGFQEVGDLVTQDRRDGSTDRVAPARSHSGGLRARSTSGGPVPGGRGSGNSHRGPRFNLFAYHAAGI